MNQAFLRYFPCDSRFLNFKKATPYAQGYSVQEVLDIKKKEFEKSSNSFLDGVILFFLSKLDFSKNAEKVLGESFSLYAIANELVKDVSADYGRVLSDFLNKGHIQKKTEDYKGEMSNCSAIIEDVFLFTIKNILEWNFGYSKKEWIDSQNILFEKIKTFLIKTLQTQENVLLFILVYTKLFEDFEYKLLSKCLYKFDQIKTTIENEIGFDHVRKLLTDLFVEKANFYRQSRDTFIRSVGEYGYIKSQLTKHDRTYTQEGRAFLEVLSRKPQSLEELSVKACEYFEDVSPADIQNDMREFYDSLVADRYLVSGETAEECAAKDTYFSYAENPKTLFKYNAQQNPDDEKLYADTQEVLGAHYREHPQIYSCQIETTNRCNERCIHCYIPHELKNVVLPYEVIESVLLQLHDLGTMGLTLSGGEFFTHPDAEKILRKARELDFSFYVLSNITLITPHMIEVLKEVNPSYVQTSLYSVYPEEHDHITQLKGSCEKTKAAVEALIAANIPVQISCPVMKTNYHSYKEVLKYAYERNCKAQTDYVMMARYDFTTDNLAERLTMEQTEELLKDIIQFDKDYLNLTDKPVPSVSREEWGKRPFCGVGMDNLCIASDGIVYPCSGWQGMACGNVREQPIKDIWEKSPQLNKLRNLTKSAIPQCYDCEDKQFCAPCLVRNFNESGGDYLKIAPHFCKAAHLNRKLVEDAKAKMRENKT